MTSGAILTTTSNATCKQMSKCWSSGTFSLYNYISCSVFVASGSIAAFWTSSYFHNFLIVTSKNIFSSFPDKQRAQLDAVSVVGLPSADAEVPAEIHVQKVLCRVLNVEAERLANDHIERASNLFVQCFLRREENKTSNGLRRGSKDLSGRHNTSFYAYISLTNK